jgi:ubiquinone/menaquinone biosynthesis C-methylase UbiE
MTMSGTNLRKLKWFLWLLCAGCANLGRGEPNDPGRDVWQQPDAVIRSLNLAPGARVADLGAGGGYVTFRLAQAVGPTGRVYAVDIDRDALDAINQHARKISVANVETVQASENDARLPNAGVDLIFTCNTVHHLQNRSDYFRSLARYLRPNGHVAIIDFTPTGFAWIFGHGTAKETIRQEMAAAGFRPTDDFNFLPKQHFQLFRQG